MIAASAAFRAAPNAAAAADVVGAMLGRWHYIALGAPLVLFALQLRHARKLALIVLFAAIVLAAAQSFVDLKIRSIRMSSPVPMSELSREDPVRRRFGMLHGVSMMLLLAQAIAAGVIVASRIPDAAVILSEAKDPPTRSSMKRILRCAQDDRARAPRRFETCHPEARRRPKDPPHPELDEEDPSLRSG